MLPVSPLIGVYIYVKGTDGHTYSPLSFLCCLLGQPVSVRGLFRLLAGPCPPPTPVAGVHVHHSDLLAQFLTLVLYLILGQPLLILLDQSAVSFYSHGLQVQLVQNQGHLFACSTVSVCVIFLHSSVISPAELTLRNVWRSFHDESMYALVDA